MKNFHRKLIWLVCVCLSLCKLSKCQAPTCLFDGCQCSLNNDNSFDIRCVHDIKSNKSGFPDRVWPIVESNSTNFTNVNILLFNKFNFATIPDRAFEGLSIRNLILADNNLQTLTSRVFDGVRNLKMLRLIEKQLHTIEKGTFEPLRRMLVELGLIELNFEPDQMSSLVDQLMVLEKLDTFKLNNMRFDYFKREWTGILANISYLSLASNRLSNLSADVFESSSSLISLDLNNNLLDNYRPLFDALQPIQSNVKELKLNGNNLSSMLDFPALINLELLDLSNNNISYIPKTTFHTLSKLNYLHLSSNRLFSINDLVFARMENLLILQLNNNYLSKFPNLTYLSRLQILDMTNQNARLTEIPDYAFERRDRNQTHYSLSLILDSNDFIKYGSRSFCSRYTNSSQIHNINLSYRSMKNLHKCLLKQLKTSFVSRVSLKVQPNDNIFDYSDVCSCDLKSFAFSLNIDLLGICVSFNDACSRSAIDSINNEQQCSTTNYNCDS